MEEKKRKYIEHRSSAKQRGIEFDLTFDEWLEIWDGNWHRRGRGSDQLGMLRTRDEGGYTVGNVRLGTPKENQQERAIGEKVKKAALWAGSSINTAAARASWLGDRNAVFREYVEDDEEMS